YEFARALAIAGDLLGEIGQHAGECLAKRRQTRVTAAVDARCRGGTGRECQHGVRGRRVAVDGDGIESVDHGLAQDRLQGGAAIGASVKTKASMVAISGAIMPAPLAKPLMTIFVAPSRVRAVASFGNVSVVMIALAASS